MSNARTYGIADLHLGHANIVKFEDGARPFASIEEHDEILVMRWNKVVRPEDSVWVLGDVYFGGRENHEILRRLNGKKRLVLGNHDYYPIENYLKYFARVSGPMEYKGCILSHIPVHPSQFARYALNLHGHTHNHVIGDLRYVCLSAEQVEYTPVLLNELIAERKRECELKDLLMRGAEK